MILKAGQGWARHGMARQGLARHGKEVSLLQKGIKHFKKGLK
jgi:hypothetical protein